MNVNSLVTLFLSIQFEILQTETQSFKIHKFKPVIEKIDSEIGAHYGFTEEELDFIINYDIKYRMGRDAGEEDA